MISSFSRGVFSGSMLIFQAVRRKFIIFWIGSMAKWDIYLYTILYEWCISRVNVDTYAMTMDPIWGWIPFWDPVLFRKMITDENQKVWWLPSKMEGLVSQWKVHHGKSDVQRLHMVESSGKMCRSPTGMLIKPCKNNDSGIDCQPQLVSLPDFWTINRNCHPSALKLCFTAFVGHQLFDPVGVTANWRFSAGLSHADDAHLHCSQAIDSDGRKPCCALLHVVATAIDNPVFRQMYDGIFCYT